MNGKNIGDPCPKCTAQLIRRPRRIVARAGGSGDMAYCAKCQAAFELLEDAAPRAAFPPALAG